MLPDASQGGGEQEPVTMIDANVVRLRRLRDAALGARALARAMDPSGSDRVLAQSALLCWSISKVVAGQLRAHPYLDYQKDQSAGRRDWDHLTASVEAAVARRLRRVHETLADDLQAVARELDRTRAVTRLQDLSDAFGRMQLRMRALMGDLEREAHVNARMPQRDEPAPSGGGAFPYLSLTVDKN
jgi:hypothetical protein